MLGLLGFAQETASLVAAACAFSGVWSASLGNGFEHRRNAWLNDPDSRRSVAGKNHLVRFG